MPGLNAPAFLANGNILPASFVKLDPTATNNFKVLQCVTSGLTDKPIGISQDVTYNPPGLQGLTGTQYAATAGQPVTVFGEADVCLLQIDPGAGVTAGDWLKSGTTGLGVTVAFTQPAAYTQNTNTVHGAVALETANLSEFCRVVVKIGVLPGISG